MVEKYTYCPGRSADIKAAQHGEGWYRFGWSDGGQTTEAVWYDDDQKMLDKFTALMLDDVAELFADANTTHFPYIDFLGDGDEPEEGLC